MYNEGTIIALSSPPGSGAIAIIRLSGDDAISKTDLFFKSKSGNKLSESSGYSISYGDLIEKDEVILNFTESEKVFDPEEVYPGIENPTKL